MTLPVQIDCVMARVFRGARDSVILRFAQTFDLWQCLRKFDVSLVYLIFAQTSLTID